MHFVIEDPVAFSFFSFRQAIVFSEFQQFAVEAEVLAVDNETSLERHSGLSTCFSVHGKLSRYI
jgi:hypothetical protein